MSRSVHLASSKLAWALVMGGGVLGCSTPPADDPIPIGLMLSFSGVFAANSANSERALLMVVDAANEAGGVDGRRLRVVARDTRSDVGKVTAAAKDLIDAGAAVIIGPDTTDLVTQLRPVLQDRTMLLPSYATASAIEWKPPSWFVMGPASARVACELVAQLRADGRQNPLVIVNPSGYNSWLAWEFANRYGMVKHVLPTDEASTTSTVRPLTGLTADAFVLAALPTSASSLMYALSCDRGAGIRAAGICRPRCTPPPSWPPFPRGCSQGPTVSPPVRSPVPRILPLNTKRAGRTRPSTTPIRSTTPAPSPSWPSAGRWPWRAPSPREPASASTSRPSPGQAGCRSPGTSLGRDWRRCAQVPRSSTSASPA